LIFGFISIKYLRKIREDLRYQTITQFIVPLFVSLNRCVKAINIIRCPAHITLYHVMPVSSRPLRALIITQFLMANYTRLTEIVSPISPTIISGIHGCQEVAHLITRWIFAPY